MIVVVIVIVLIVFSGPVYMYIRARQAVSVDVQALSLDEILDIGTKTSESALRRVRGRAQVFQVPELPGGAAWNARNGHVYCTYYVAPLPGVGYRVAATARPQALIRMFSLRDMTQAMSRKQYGGSEYVGGQIGSWLGQKIWLWSHARKVLFRRWRTFSALRQADARKLAAVGAQSGASLPDASGA